MKIIARVVNQSGEIVNLLCYNPDGAYKIATYSKQQLLEGMAKGGTVDEYNPATKQFEGLDSLPTYSVQGYLMKDGKPVMYPLTYVIVLKKVIDKNGYTFYDIIQLGSSMQSVIVNHVLDKVFFNYDKSNNIVKVNFKFVDKDGSTYVAFKKGEMPVENLEEKKPVAQPIKPVKPYPTQQAQKPQAPQPVQKAPEPVKEEPKSVKEEPAPVVDTEPRDKYGRTEAERKEFRASQSRTKVKKGIASQMIKYFLIDKAELYEGELKVPNAEYIPNKIIEAAEYKKKGVYKKDMGIYLKVIGEIIKPLLKSDNEKALAKKDLKALTMFRERANIAGSSTKVMPVDFWYAVQYIVRDAEFMNVFAQMYQQALNDDIKRKYVNHQFGITPNKALDGVVKNTTTIPEFINFLNRYNVKNVDRCNHIGEDIVYTVEKAEKPEQDVQNYLIYNTEGKSSTITSVYNLAYKFDTDPYIKVSRSLYDYASILFIRSATQEIENNIKYKEGSPDYVLSDYTINELTFQLAVIKGIAPNLYDVFIKKNRNSLKALTELKSPKESVVKFIKKHYKDIKVKLFDENEEWLVKATKPAIYNNASKFYINFDKLFDEYKKEYPEANKLTRSTLYASSQDMH